jgi:hypothetical protein
MVELGGSGLRDLAVHVGVAVEFSDTRVFDRPAAARLWFEETLREQLALGRPDRIAIVFRRRIVRTGPRPTLGRFETRVMGDGVEPSLQIRHRSSKLKQYLKKGRTLRTETTVNDTRDFAIGRRLRAENFARLRAVGQAANARLLELECAARPCAPDADTLARVVLPSRQEGLPAPALRFGDPRVMARRAPVLRAPPEGFRNASLRALIADLLAAHPIPRAR